MIVGEHKHNVGASFSGLQRWSRHRRGEFPTVQFHGEHDITTSRTSVRDGDTGCTYRINWTYREGTSFRKLLESYRYPYWKTPTDRQKGNAISDCRKERAEGQPPREGRVPKVTLQYPVLDTLKLRGAPRQQ